MKNLYTSVLFVLLAIVAKAQFSPAYNAMKEREMQSHVARFGGDENTSDAINGLDYDLVYYRLELRLNPDSNHYVKGAITTYFKTGKSNFNRINFDMANALGCDSVYYHGVKLAAASVVEQVDTLRITLPNIPVMGTLDSVKVFYKGVPPQVPTWTNTGFVRSNTTRNASNQTITVPYYIYTLSEPYSAYTWWPSKSRIAHDKADSVDIYVSTPSAHRVAANGKRISEDITGANRMTYWKHRYPISTYQIAIGVARYAQYPATPTLVNIGGTNMELYNLYWTGTNTTPPNTVALDRTADMLTVMSNRFSDYPFKNEKYGHYTFGFGGGMEHNTFSGMGPLTMDQASDWSIVAHELGHQWFGGSVTCGSWADIWVNEGFARYSESVYLEGKTDATLTTTPATHRGNYKSAAIAATAQTMYRDTTDMQSIFGSSVYIYERGAMFISMLRKTLGDTKFFQALQNYQTDPTLRYQNAYTDDVKRHMEAVSGLDLDEMFNDWVYRRGHGRYLTARWNNIGNQVVIHLPQTIAGTDNTHFDAPIVLRFSKTGPAEDTTIVLFDKQGVLNRVNNGVFTSSSGGSIIQVALPFTPTTAQFDPVNETLLEGAIVKDAGLALLATKIVDFSAVREGKNAKLSWAINQAVDYASFEIERSTDGSTFRSFANQREDQNGGATSFSQTDYNIPAGLIYYRIKIIEKDGSSFYTKVASINNKSSESFIVSPNPATDHIMISHASNAAITVNIRITDASGKTVKALSKQLIAAGGRLRIPLQGYAAGTYYVEMEGEEYFKVTRKISLVK